MTSNVVDLKPKPKPKPKRKKSDRIDSKKLLNEILESKPVGVFAMTWDKEGIVTFYSTHGENKQHFIRSNLLFFLTGFARRDLFGDEE
jgi:hypothetical protein